MGKVTLRQRPSDLPLFLSVQLEEQLSRLQREKNEIQNRLEEDQEDMNELMKKHKAAVAQVPGPGVPTAPCAAGTALLTGAQRSSILGAVAVLAVPGTQSRVEGGTFEGYGGSCSALTPFPGLPGPGSDE